MMKAIVCIGANGVMGKNGSMPWGDKPLDGKHFRRLTEGHTVVMGRKTYESMKGELLPNRKNIVLSRQELWGAGAGWLRAYSIDPILKLTEDVWIIGGSEVYKAFLPHIEEFYITTVGEAFEGDTYFPDIHRCYDWRSESLDIQEKGGYKLIFRKLTKIRRESF